MDYKYILKHEPYLKLVNTNNISQRLLEQTNNNAFIVFNTIRNQYELHTINAYKISGDSFNAPINQESLCNWIIQDYKQNNHRANYQNIESELEELEAFKDKKEKERFNLDEMFKSVERTLGTKV